MAKHLDHSQELCFLMQPKLPTNVSYSELQMQMSRRRNLTMCGKQSFSTLKMSNSGSISTYLLTKRLQRISKWKLKQSSRRMNLTQKTHLSKRTYWCITLVLARPIRKHSSWWSDQCNNLPWNLSLTTHWLHQSLHTSTQKTTSQVKCSCQVKSRAKRHRTRRTSYSKQ